VFPICVAVYCNVLQCVAVRCGELRCVALSLISGVYPICFYGSKSHSVPVPAPVSLCYSVLQRVAIRCNVLQCVAVCFPLSFYVTGVYLCHTASVCTSIRVLVYLFLSAIRARFFLFLVFYVSLDASFTRFTTQSSCSVASLLFLTRACPLVYTQCRHVLYLVWPFLVSIYLFL